MFLAKTLIGPTSTTNREGGEFFGLLHAGSTSPWGPQGMASELLLGCIPPRVRYALYCSKVYREFVIQSSVR